MTVATGNLQLLHQNKEVLSRQLKQDVMEIFSTMVGLEDLLHLPATANIMTDFNDCVSSLVGLTGEYNGLVGLHMPNSLAMNVASGMLGMEVTELDDDLKDAIGEIGNMIAGSFKNQLSKSGLDIQLSMPSVIYGGNYGIAPGNIRDHIAIQFATDEEWFMVAVALE
jgi:chemotaxis protein CheX